MKNLRVFVAARNADREGMPPLAAISLVVGNLPIMVQLDNSLAVGPFDLSSAGKRLCFCFSILRWHCDASKGRLSSCFQYFFPQL